MLLTFDYTNVNRVNRNGHYSFFGRFFETKIQARITATAMPWTQTHLFAGTGLTMSQIPMHIVTKTSGDICSFDVFNVRRTEEIGLEAFWTVLDLRQAVVASRPPCQTLICLLESRYCSL